MKGFWRLLSRIKSYRKNFIWSIMSNIMLSVFTVISIPLLIPFFQILFDRVDTVAPKPDSWSLKYLNEWIRYVMTDVITTYGKDYALVYICLLMIAIFFLKNLFRYLALYFMAPLRYGIIYDIRKQLFEKYLALPLSFYSDEKKGALMSSMTTDVQEVEWSIMNVIEALFKSPIIMAGSIIFMLLISTHLTIFVFGLVLFSGLVIGRVVNTIKARAKNAQSLIASINSTLEETLSGLRIIKGFNAENYVQSKFDRENQSFRNTIIQLVNRRDSASPLSEFLGVTVVTVLLYYGSRLVFNEELAPETFFAFVFAFYQVIEPAKSFSSAYFNIQKGMAAMDRIDKVLLTKNNIMSPPDAVNIGPFNHNITFKDVTFTYNNAEKPALKNINIDIKKGQIVALVGSSGAGKSTFVDLLPRFYDVTNGVILIDGTDIKKSHLSQLRNLFGIVSQEAILFNDTIARNISFGDEKYTQKEIEAAARIANAHDFICQLPQGYDFNIGDRGSKLSGGQRQRITIARAILRNPAILILDEATSALDSESEKFVQEALEQIMKNRTSIIVAHRLSTIQNADVILVFESGQIVQKGNHSQLMREDGPYRNFVQMQTFE